MTLPIQNALEGLNVMFRSKPYRPDGGYRPRALLPLAASLCMGAAILGGIFGFLGGIFGFFRVYFFFLPLLFLAGCAFLLCHYIGVPGVVKAHLRNTPWAVFMNVVSAVVAFFARHYAYFLCMRSQWAQDANWPYYGDSFYAYFNTAVDEGVTLTSWKSSQAMELRGWGVVVLWSIEFILWCGIGLMLVRAARQPYSIRHAQWKSSVGDVAFRHWDTDRIIGLIHSGRLEELSSYRFDLWAEHEYPVGDIVVATVYASSADESIDVGFESVVLTLNDRQSVKHLGWRSFEPRALPVLVPGGEFAKASQSARRSARKKPHGSQKPPL